MGSRVFAERATVEGNIEGAVELGLEADEKGYEPSRPYSSFSYEPAMMMKVELDPWSFPRLAAASRAGTSTALAFPFAFSDITGFVEAIDA